MKVEQFKMCLNSMVEEKQAVGPIFCIKTIVIFFSKPVDLIC